MLQGIRARIAIRRRARCAVAAEILSVPGTMSLRVGSDSMLPSLWPGDVIAVRRARARDINPGALVVYALKDFTVHRAARWDPGAASMRAGVIVNMFTVHRAVGWNRDALITRGDALPENDPPVRPSRVFGEVVAIQRGRSRLLPRAQLGRVQKFSCFFLRRSRRLRSLVMRLHGLWRAVNCSQPSPELVS